jgi:hypothetical protein
MERGFFKMIEGKGLGNKKVNRVNLSLTNKSNNKLNKLATACNMKPTTLACLLLEIGLDSSDLINKLQDEYNVHNAYRVVLVKDFRTNELQYVLNERW